MGNRLRNASGFLSLLVLAWSTSSFAFTCRALGVTVDPLGSERTVNVMVNLQPSLRPGQNLVIDLSRSISCLNNDPSLYLDPVWIARGSSYSGVLSHFTGSISYYGRSYPFPLTAPTSFVNHTWGTFRPWEAVLYLTPVSTASGVFIKSGSPFASLRLEKRNSITGLVSAITWNLTASNSVIIPTGGCDVSARDITVSLPDYPATANIPLTVRCAKNQKLAFYLSGTTINSDESIFINSATGTAARGIGVQILRNGSAVPANNNISLGVVGTSPMNLGLTTSYARTSGPVTAGNVQSLIGVTFVYE
ncbi:TPA: fimbrial protein [Pseudomonas aeruginosa]|nr:fimbrial protein [Pseudomonas aeruginosa]